ncbi:MAG: hypothetical protein ABFR97_10450 [Thermodesulfobacteriota bacterium]
MYPLGIVKQIVEEAGMDIAYVYEDLVSLNHNGFMLQFTENDQEVLLHINHGADGEQVGSDITTLVTVAKGHGLTFAKGQFYILTDGQDETVNIQFSED